MVFIDKPEGFYAQYKTASALLEAVTDDRVAMVTDELQSGAWPNDETIDIRAAQSSRASERVAEVLARNKKHYLLNKGLYIKDARHTADREGIEIVPPMPEIPSAYEMRQYFRRQDEQRWGASRSGRTH